MNRGRFSRLRQKRYSSSIGRLIVTLSIDVDAARAAQRGARVGRIRGRIHAEGLVDVAVRGDAAAEQQAAERRVRPAAVAQPA